MMSNKTTGFSAELSTSFYLVDVGALGVYWLYVAPVYSDGMQCHQLLVAHPQSAPSWAVSWGTVGPGSSTTPHYAYFIAREYFTPNHPEGDRGKLWQAILQPNTLRNVDSFRGPGAISDPIAWDQVFLRLSGVPCPPGFETYVQCEIHRGGP